MTDPTRPASRATLSARGRDSRTQVGETSERLVQLQIFQAIGGLDAVQSLPFTGRVARAAGRVGFEG
jgi:vacuolar-type H+-ATPase subunit B/Vma2